MPTYLIQITQAALTDTWYPHTIQQRLATVLLHHIRAKKTFALAYLVVARWAYMYLFEELGRLTSTLLGIPSISEAQGREDDLKWVLILGFWAQRVHGIVKWIEYPFATTGDLPYTPQLTRYPPNEMVDLTSCRHEIRIKCLSRAWYLVNCL